jgi:uncharacterized protein (TIGR02145 family)
MRKTVLTAFMPFLFAGLYILTCCDKEEPEPESTTVIDYDGNVYNTVQIFNRGWMAENLRTTRLNNGTMITLVSDDWNWDFLDEPKRCYYNNDGQANRDVYGHLYNYFAVNSGRLCPSGWHIPTKEEWGTLIGYLGGYSAAGGKLKESGTIHWITPNTGADNSFDFTALPGGFRTSEGSYEQIGYAGFWWCTGNHEGLSLSYNSSSVSFQWFADSYGASVRCVKDL